MSASRSLVLCHLYPDLLNLYGDRGNIIALMRRCEWRGIELKLLSASLGDRVDFKEVDLVFIGGGSDKEQSILFRDFLESKGPALEEAARSGLPLLAVCGGYQLLGRFYRTAAGEEMPGLGLFDAWTVAGRTRLIGNVVAECVLGGTLVGFENHSGRTYLDEAGQTRPFARVVVGNGNNGTDRGEGALLSNAIGTYLHGPLLPKNPEVADWLLSRALLRRYGDPALDPLDDAFEKRAHRAILERFGRH